MPVKKYNAVGIGNAIVDVLANVEDDFLHEHNLRKGMMRLVDELEVKRLHTYINTVKEVSGGSAANTIAGLASLGNSAAFMGKVRDDPLGGSFEKGLKELGVNYCTKKAGSGQPTACCMVLTTPDAQRTMSTCLGISGSMGPEDIDETIISQSEIIYLEGYLWDRDEAKKAFKKAVRIARGTDGRVALSLSDSFCVKRHRVGFLDLVKNHIDILFANEEEIKSLFKTSTLEAAISGCRETKNICALTRSEKGSIIIFKDKTHMISPERNINVVDTTGAGDLYASGFLHGLIKGLDLKSCGKIGSIIAAEVISHFGARPKVSLIELVSGRGF
ncbi:5-dehydro-2-deoxygluconokinase [subsurface metagenome]|nr:adenosine kinase [Clostridia bacterium]